MKRLNEDIKTGQFKSVYLLFGEEAYLKKQYKARLTKAMLPENETVNYAYFEGKGIHIPEMIDLAETMPFFAERRLIVVEDSGFFKNAAPELADYIKEIPATTHFIFVEEEVDKRGRMYKAVKDKGCAVELGRQDERTLVLWILGQAKREGKRMSESAVRHLILKTGTDMEHLDKELEKLFCYTMGREEIREKDIDAICTTQITNKIFDMVEAVAKKRQKEALDYYYELLTLKEPPMRILYLLARQFQLLLQVRMLVKKGYGKKQVAQEAGIHPFAAGKYIEQCRNFSTGELRAVMEEAADMEESVKTGRLNDRMSVEIFIIKNSQRS